MWYHKLRAHPFGLYVLAGIILLLLIMWTKKRQASKPCLQLQAQITPSHLRFVSKAQLLQLADTYSRRPIIGQSTYRLDLQHMENQLARHPFIKKIEVYTNHDGSLQLQLAQKEPLARLIYKKGEEKYITQSGEITNLSSNFSAKVPLVRLPYASEQEQAGWHQSAHQRHALWKLLNKLEKDAFWSIQIAELIVDQFSNLYLYTQISKQRVFFGKLEKSEEKLKKLKLFYTHILPQKGWNRYKEVDLRFHNQIVCK